MELSNIELSIITNVLKDKANDISTKYLENLKQEITKSKYDNTVHINLTSDNLALQRINNIVMKFEDEMSNRSNNDKRPN